MKLAACKLQKQPMACQQLPSADRFLWRNRQYRNSQDRQLLYDKWRSLCARSSALDWSSADDLDADSTLSHQVRVLESHDDEDPRAGQGRFVAMTLRIKGAEDWEELLSILEGHPRSAFNFINAAAALVHAGQLATRLDPEERQRMADSGLLQRLFEMTEWSLPRYRGREVANSLHALARLRRAGTSDRVIAGLAAAAAARSGELQAQEVANTLWALATLAAPHGAARSQAWDPRCGTPCVAGDWLLLRLARQVWRQLWRFKPQELANTLWAFGVLSFRPPEAVLQGLLQHFHAQREALKASEVCMGLWAVARLGTIPDEQWLADFSREIRQRAPAFSSEEMVTMLKAFADAGWPADEMMLWDTSDELLLRMRKMSTPELCGWVWVYGRLRWRPHEVLLAELDGQLSRRAEDIGASHLVGILYCISTWGWKPALKTQARLIKRAAVHASAYSPQELAQLLLAFSKMGTRLGSPLLESLAARMDATLHGFSFQAVATALFSLARLRHPLAAPRLRALAAQALATVKEASSLGMMNLVWAFAIYHHHPGPALLAAAEPLLLQQRELPPKQLAAVVWALGRLEETPRPRLAAFLASQAEVAIPELPASTLFPMAVGLTGTSCATPALLSALAARTRQLAPAMEPRQLQRTLQVLSGKAFLGSAGNKEARRMLAKGAADVL